MGLMKRIAEAQRRRRIQAFFIAKDTRREQRLAIEASKDGGLLIHKAIEAAS